MWKYYTEEFPDKESILKEVSRLMDGTVQFRPVVHFIVNEDNNVVAMNISGPDAVANFTQIVLQRKTDLGL